jgi:transposase
VVGGVGALTFEGYCHSTLIVSWFKQQLCPALWPGQVVILDNARPPDGATRFSRRGGLQITASAALLPDLNKIEHLWAWIKLLIALDHSDQPFRQK